MTRVLRPRAGAIAVHLALVSYCVVALAPIVLVIVNSFKTRRGIFADPLGLPADRSFSLAGYSRVLQDSHIGLYFANSLIVTGVSLVAVVLFGAMAAWALNAYRFRGRGLLGLFLAIGIMVPIRLGTISILQTMAGLGLVNSLGALVLVYIAQALPLAIFILSEFIAQVPRDLADAARCDGVGEVRIFWAVIFPLIRPALAIVAIFVMVPIWNDLWFPLILAPGEQTRTITLGVQQFVGQYVTDWSAVLAALTLAIVPVAALYLLLSRQLVRGLTAGALK